MYHDPHSGYRHARVVLSRAIPDYTSGSHVHDITSGYMCLHV
jgi:hypothetical protein